MRILWTSAADGDSVVKIIIRLQRHSHCDTVQCLEDGVGAEI